MPVYPPTRIIGSGHYPDGFIVPAGEVWQLVHDQDVLITTGGNIVVEGVLIAIPTNDVTHTIRFVGINNTNYFGGGHQVRPSDIGLWVTGSGQLHFEGTYRQAWNRTGTHETWLATDDLWQAPSGFDTDGKPLLDPTPYALGNPLDTWEPTQVSYDNGKYARSYTNEAFNLTRNLILESEGEGQAHLIFLHCQRPQHLANLTINNFGPRKIVPGARNPGYDGVIGRYPVHFHHCGDGARGSIVSGVVVRDSGNRAFVPHASNGIFFNDCIAWEATFTPFWWDHNDENDHSHHLTFNHCAAVRVYWSDTIRGYGLSAFKLNGGTGNAIVDSLATGSQGRKVNGGAFMWPSHTHARWGFENNVAHNNRGNGIGIWQNTDDPHTIAGCVSYNNGESGIVHGAYNNHRWRYFQNVSFDNVISDVSMEALGKSEFIDNDFGHVHFTKHVQPSASDINETVFFSGRGWKIDRISIDETVNSGVNGGLFRFKSDYMLNDLKPEDFNYDPAKVLSTIHIDNQRHPDFTI